MTLRKTPNIFNPPAIIMAVAVLMPLILSVYTQEKFRPHAIHGNDGFLNYAYLRSILVSGDLDFRNDYWDFDHLGRNYSYSMMMTPRDVNTGRPVNRYGWGSSLLWLPFTLQAHLIALTVPGIEANGLTAPYHLSIRIGSAFWGLLGLFLLMKVARRRLLPQPEGEAERRLTLWTAVGLIGTTNLGFYLFLHPSMSTAPAFGLAGVMIWLIDRISDKPTGGNWFFLGMAWALLGCTRYGDLGFLLGVIPAAVLAGLHAKGGIGGLRTPTAIPALLSGIAPVAMCQMTIWWYLYGTPFAGPTPYLGDEYPWAIPGQHSLAVLFSFHHGWITWHPIILLGVIGMAMISFNRSMPTWLRLLPVAVLGHLLVVGAWSEWTGGASFGGRLMATSLSVVFLGLIPPLHWISKKWGRFWPPTLIIVLGLWNLGFMAQYAFGAISRQGSVSPLELAVNQWRLIENLFH